MHNRSIWNELMELIAKYDWAVEGFSPPADCMLTRSEAVKIREGLVKLTGELAQ